METKTQTKLSTLSTAHHHHYIQIYKFFLRIYDIILGAISIFFEILGYLLSLCLFFIAVSICLTAVLIIKLYFDVRKFVTYCKKSRLYSIFVRIKIRFLSNISR